MPKKNKPYRFILLSAIYPAYSGSRQFPFALGGYHGAGCNPMVDHSLKKKRAGRRFGSYSFFEFRPAWLFYFPIALQYLYLSIRFRSFTLPTAANPGMKGGAFIGESKSEILNLVPESIKKWVDPHITIKRPANAWSMEEVVKAAMDQLKAADILLPLVAKPDIGQKGFGVRPIRREKELVEYLTSFPEGGTVILQRMVCFEKEAGIFYIRQPFEEGGEIFSINYKIFPTLTVTGKHTLKELIMADLRSKRLRRFFLNRHKENWMLSSPKMSLFNSFFQEITPRGASLRTPLIVKLPNC